MQNRARDEVIRDVLHAAAGGGAGISKIMFKAYLSHAQAKEYLSILIGQGMVAKDERLGNNNYSTTGKGMEYLSSVDVMSELLATGAKRRSNVEEAFMF